MRTTPYHPQMVWYSGSINTERHAQPICRRESHDNEEICEPSQDEITKATEELNGKKIKNHQKGPLDVKDKENGCEVTAITNKDECSKQRTKLSTTRGLIRTGRDRR